MIDFSIYLCTFIHRGEVEPILSPQSIRKNLKNPIKATKNILHKLIMKFSIHKTFLYPNGNIYPSVI